MDAFLSYNRADAAAVNTLDTWLASHGLRCFLDTRELSSGGAWLPELERAITRDAAAMLVLVGPAGLGNTQHYEYQLGLTRQAAEPAFPLIPVLLPGTPEYRFPRGFLGLQTWVNFAEGLNDPAAQQRLLAAIRRESLDPEAVRGAICPYKGLEAFQEEDGKIFFGRDVEAAQLHRTVIEHGVAAVIGRSGSGKSSLARAGLLPLLRQKSAGGWGVVWDRLVLRPGRYPLSALAEALDPPQAPPNNIIEYGAALRRTADLLRGQHPDFVAELLHRRLDALDRRTDRFLILLDQAEEMFARPIELTDAQAIRDWQADTEKLIALLLGAAQRGPASLVLTIRSDFFDPLQHSPMGPLLNKAMVATRGVQDLRAAVAGPAALVGLRFSPGLEDRILRETGTDEGNLPLLQHALKRSWELREEGMITSAAYDRSGGVEQAINLAAQSAFDSLGSEGQAAAKRLFLRLVRPGEGRGHVHLRAPLPEEGAQRVVAEFFGAPERRLLFFGQVDGRNTVEVAHEALIRGWPTLLAWVEENRERLDGRAAVLDWIRGSGGELLPAGALLARASALLAAPGDVALEDIAPLIRASEAAAARALEERAAQAAREARLAADRAEAAERLVRRTRLAAAGLGVLAFIALGSGLYAWVQRGAAEQSATMAEQRRGEAEAAAARAEAARQTAEAEQARAEREEAAAAAARGEALRQAQSAQTSAALAEQRRAEAEAETQRAEREAEAAEAARARAETGFAAARDTAHSLVFDLAAGLRNREGMPTALVRDLLDRAGRALDALLARTPDDPATLRLRGVAYGEFATTFATLGDTPRQREAAQQAVGIFARLAERDPGNTAWQRDLSVSHERIGLVLRAQGDLPGALRAYQARMAIATRLAERDPGNTLWQRDLSISHNRIGNVLVAQGDLPGALRAYQAGMAIRMSLAERDPGNTLWQRDVFVSHASIGTVLEAQGDRPGALGAYQAGMAIATRLAERDPGNTDWQRDLSVSHERIGDALRAQGDLPGALRAYQAGMAIATRLAERDPGNAGWQRDLSISHERIGVMLHAQGDLPGALRAYQAGMVIRTRLAERDPGNAEWQRDLNSSQFTLGLVHLGLGQPAEARPHAEAALALARDRRARFPDQPQTASDLAAAEDLLRRIEAASQ